MGGDHGVDVISRKGGESIAIQCKFYKIGSNIGNKDISHLEGGRHVYQCTKAIFITTSDYTKKAREMGRSLDITLWRSADLERELSKYFPDPKLEEITALQTKLHELSDEERGLTHSKVGDVFGGIDPRPQDLEMAL